MNYEITLPLASVNYPGPSKSIRILSSCVWFYNRVDAGDTMFFCYDSPDTFAFGLSSGTKMISKINHTISSSKYGFSNRYFKAMCQLHFSQYLRCHCNGKIIDLILIATEQHFRTKLNGAFSFLISCLVFEVFRFLKHAN